MKIKIFANGNPLDSKVMNAETGELLQGVVSAHVDIDVEGAVATLIIHDFEADIECEAKLDEATQGVYGDPSAGSLRENSNPNS